jgi:hypothetical protein
LPDGDQRGYSASVRPPHYSACPTLATGRTALVARLRTIAARVEALPLDSAAEVLVLLEPALAAFE